jgi:FlaA1/EpsC-like NDP-sugar epimerase
MNLLQSYLKKLIPKIMGLSLMNRWIVFVIDLFLCTVAFLVAVYMRFLVDPDHPIPYLFFWLGLFLAFNAVAFRAFKSYRGLIRHSNFQEMWRVFAALFFSCCAFYLTIRLSSIDIPYRYFLVQNILMLSLGMMLAVRLLIVFLYYYTMNYSGKESKSTLIYGVGAHSLALAQWVNKSARNKNLVQGFLMRNRKARNMRIQDLPVYDLDTDNTDWYMHKHSISTILFPDYVSLHKEKIFVENCLKIGLSVMVSPPFEGVKGADKVRYQMKPIQFEDLLGREEIQIDMERIGVQLYGKVILITGAAGSIGSELVRQLVTFKPKLLILFDLAETPLHDLRLELSKDYPDLTFVPIIGDIRSANRLSYVFRTFQPQVVYHAAAYKHVPLMEENPCEAVLANVMGTKLLANFAEKYQVERFVMISTDKAVNPTNVMGASKRMAEIYVQSLAKTAQQKGYPTQFVTTRFGNVLGSNGSVIPHFKAQIERGGPVTVTHPDILRYFMTIPEACRLVLQAASFGKSGEIYVFDMGEPVKIVDLAKKLIVMAGLVPNVDIQIEFTGLRPGEKLYEELLNNNETTLKTEHKKITIAQVRQYEFAAVDEKIQYTIDCASKVDIAATIKAMKDIVPEYKSQNSPFEVFDKVELLYEGSPVIS